MQVGHLFFQHKKGADYFFKDLSFELEEGRIHALHGKNGIGKSVLLQVLNKNIAPGSIVSGTIVSEKTDLLCQQFDFTLANEFTFLENLQCSKFNKFPSFFRLKKKVDYMNDILGKFHIDPNIAVYKLSGGQRQILALLMKLAKEPKILFLDEPTSTLDEENAEMVFKFLQTLSNITLLVICHDQKLIQKYATGTHFHIEKNQDGSRSLIF
jgi:ABC-type multidrug transport system ATPase subunit